MSKEILDHLQGEDGGLGCLTAYVHNISVSYIREVFTINLTHHTQIHTQKHTQSHSRKCTRKHTYNAHKTRLLGATGTRTIINKLLK